MVTARVTRIHICTVPGSGFVQISWSTSFIVARLDHCSKHQERTKSYPLPWTTLRSVTSLATRYECSTKGLCLLLWTWWRGRFFDAKPFRIDPHPNWDFYDICSTVSLVDVMTVKTFEVSVFRGLRQSYTILPFISVGGRPGAQGRLLY